MCVSAEIQTYVCVSSELVVAVVARKAPGLPCHVWPAGCGHGLFECAGTGHLIECSSGSSTDTRKGAPVCAQWRAVLVCMYMKRSFHKPHMLGHPQQSSRWGPGIPGSKQEGQKAAVLWIQERGRQ